MDARTFRGFLDLLMCSDPWPVDRAPHRDNSQKIIDEWADKEARRHGYSDWIEAYHKMIRAAAPKEPLPEKDSEFATTEGAD